ncbi:hypothetical protein [Bacillus thuringiensis]|uniref:hypothetical protein n=1 Tax=Bacillus thuringiensis TaxID=1428 RepID=UPI001593749B|nr:hypothetical protein [Bacillus thuringiensis]MED3180210.1 hypothetical protein [Bacillus thuringiensis]
MSNQLNKHSELQKRINEKLSDLNKKTETNSKSQSTIKPTNSSIFSKSVKPFEIK